MKKYTSKEALDLLNEMEILMCINNKGNSFFAKKGDKIFVKSNSFTYRISIDEFKNLYQDESFVIHEIIKKEEVNLEKDDEYYAWKHK